MELPPGVGVLGQVDRAHPDFAEVLEQSELSELLDAALLLSADLLLDVLAGHRIPISAPQNRG